MSDPFAMLQAAATWLQPVLRTLSGESGPPSSEPSSSPVKPPTLLQRLYSWPPSPPRSSSRETAWLDGLRGVAAFLVMTYHYHLQWWWVQLEAPYGSSPQISLTEIWRLPFLRLLVCGGHAQVSVFFVLSGFVLSWRPLGLLDAGRVDDAFASISSAAFRRWLRLYLPCFAVGLWSVFEIQAGIGKVPVEKASNVLVQLWRYVTRFEDWSQPISIDRSEMGYYFPFHGTMWTIPLEFKGSILVFLLVLSLGRIRSYERRVFVISVMALYAMFNAFWTYWLFASGVLLAEYVRHNNGFVELSRTTTSTFRSVLIALFILSLFLAGVPSQSMSYSQTGYTWLESMTPLAWQKIEGGGRWWWCWAGLLFVFTSSHLAPVMAFFEWPACRYLGRISFMLYLTHFSVYHLLKDVRGIISGFLFMQKKQSDFLGIETWEGDALRSTVRDILTWVVLGPIAIFVANWAETYIDRPSVQFAKWVDGRFVNGPGTSTGAVTAKQEEVPEAATGPAVQNV